MLSNVNHVDHSVVKKSHLIDSILLEQAAHFDGGVAAIEVFGPYQYVERYFSKVWQFWSDGGYERCVGFWPRFRPGFSTRVVVGVQAARIYGNRLDRLAQLFW